MLQTRQEHLTWCKTRALKYFENGDLINAVTSMMSDMEKHPECGISPVLMQLGMMEMINQNRDGVKRWITGFN